MSKFIKKIKENRGTIVASCATGVSLLASVPAHAEGDMTTVSTAITTGLIAGKEDVVLALTGVLGVGLAIYMLKFGAKQALNFFSMIANKK